MVDMLLHRLAAPSLLIVALLLAGCGSSVITSDCEELARTHCEDCQRCGTEDIPPGPLCALALPTFSVESCVAAIVPRCEQQTPLIDDLEARYETCQDALAGQQCAELYERHAHDRDPFTPVCRFFF